MKYKVAEVNVARHDNLYITYVITLTVYVLNVICHQSKHIIQIIIIITASTIIVVEIHKKCY